MPKLSPADENREGFRQTVPISTKMLVSPVRLMPAHKANEQARPYARQLKGLWDTGAQSSTISSAIATDLGLPAIGERYMIGAGGKFRAKEYLAGLILPSGVKFHQISLFSFIGSADFDMLIGMDIITQGDFLVSTHGGIMHFSFRIPSAGGFFLQDVRHP